MEEKGTIWGCLKRNEIAPDRGIEDDRDKNKRNGREVVKYDRGNKRKEREGMYRGEMVTYVYVTKWGGRSMLFVRSIWGVWRWSFRPLAVWSPLMEKKNPYLIRDAIEFPRFA